MGVFLEFSIRLLMILSMFFGDYLPIINHNYGSLILSCVLVIALFIVFYVSFNSLDR